MGLYTQMDLRARRMKWLCAAVFIAMSAIALPAAAQESPNDVVTKATQSLENGRPGEAITTLESLADRGVIDPIISFDRGLAYAERIRIGAEQPGDLGRAAHGFEEARSLSNDDVLRADAARALGILRTEVTKRRVQAGGVADIEPSPTAWRAFAGILPENGWAVFAIACSLLAAAALYILLFQREARREVRMASGLALTFAPVLAGIAMGATLTRASVRKELRAAVVVVPSARLLDAKGQATTAAALPEAARVEVDNDATLPDRVHVRWGSQKGWLPETSVRFVATAR